MGKWGIRLLASELGLVEQVPRARLNAATSLNPDYNKLAERNVPIIVFSPTHEIFFPTSDVAQKVSSLRKDHPGSKIVLISSDVGHDFPHRNPSGVAYAIETVKERVGIA